MAKWKLVQVKTHDDGRPGMELEIDGHRMRRGEFFRAYDAPRKIDYVAAEKRHGPLRFSIVADRYDDDGVQIRDYFGNKTGCVNLVGRTEGDDLEYLPDFKEVNPVVEESKGLWAAASETVKEKFKAQSAPADWNEDGTPNFKMITCAYGLKGLRDELDAMECDFIGEFASHPKFPREQFIGFATEEEAMAAFTDDDRWLIRKWNGHEWLGLKKFREEGTATIKLVWSDQL